MINYINRCLSLVVMFIFLSLSLSIQGVNAEEMSHQGMDHDAMDKKAMEKQSMEDNTMDHKAMGHNGMDKNTKETKSMDHGSMDHHKMDMSDMHHESKQTKKPTQAKLLTLEQIPDSGRSREAGFDGRYNMEPTSKLYDAKTRCANASRGLVMLDNATLAKCETKFQDNPSNSGTMNTSGKKHEPHMMH